MRLSLILREFFPALLLLGGREGGGMRGGGGWEGRWG